MEKNNSLTIGERIKQCRLEHGMTQKDLAERMGISPIGISQYENGKRSPKIETVDRIAAAIGVDPAYLSNRGGENMNDLKVFEDPDFFPEFGKVRAIELCASPWFVGEDVASSIGYENPDSAVAKYVDPDNTTIYRLNGNDCFVLINMEGVYDLADYCYLHPVELDKAHAEAFVRWIETEIVPHLSQLTEIDRNLSRLSPENRTRVALFSARLVKEEMLTNDKQNLLRIYESLNRAGQKRVIEFARTTRLDPRFSEIEE